MKNHLRIVIAFFLLLRFFHMVKSSLLRCRNSASFSSVYHSDNISSLYSSFLATHVQVKKYALRRF